MSKLVLYLPDGSLHDIPLDKERLTIGRRADNDICLPYPAVSGEHAAVVTILADSFLEDLGSTNGTLVNGAAVSKHFLRDRDRIDVGQQILTYVADDAAAVEPPPPTGKSEDAPGHGESTAPALIAPAVLRAKRRSDVAAPAPVSPTKAVGQELRVVMAISPPRRLSRRLPRRPRPKLSAPSPRRRHDGRAWRPR